MSKLKPCPVCSNSKTIKTVDDVTYCQYINCLFECPEVHWNQLPRTTWVSVDERLPMVNELYFVRFGGDTYGCTTYIFSEAGFHEDGVTHWLDNLPPIPTGAPNGERR